MGSCLIISVVLFFAFFIIWTVPVSILAQIDMESWQVYVDPAKRYTLSYPSELQLEGKENFLSSVDLTLVNASFSREFKITVRYNDDDTSILSPVDGSVLSPENYLLLLEKEIKPSYQAYNIDNNFLKSDSLYGFPTVTNTVDFTGYSGESGRTMNTLGIINSKGSFLFSYSNAVNVYNKYLPIANQIIKSIVVLK